MTEKEFVIPRNVHSLTELHDVVTGLASALAPAEDQFRGLIKNLRDKLRAALVQTGIPAGRADALAEEVCGSLSEVGELTAHVATAARGAAHLVDQVRTEGRKARGAKQGFEVDA